MQKIYQFYRDLLVDNKNWLWAMFVLFMVSIIAGIFAFNFHPEFIETIINSFVEKFGESPALDIHLAIKIFLQNLLASAIALFGGIFLGIISLLAVAANGVIIGYVLAYLFRQQDAAASLLIVLQSLIPHGIFELPAYLIAAGLGLRLGMEWLSSNSNGIRWQVTKTNLKNAVLVYPLVIVLLFVAALVEVFISG